MRNRANSSKFVCFLIVFIVCHAGKKTLLKFVPFSYSIRLYSFALSRSTLHRVIDVLGLQMIDNNTNSSYGQGLEKNPAYRNLKAQQEIVNGAIEHMAVM